MDTQSSLLEQITLTNGHVIVLVEDRKIVATCEYDWIKDYQDLLRAERGERPVGGEVLFVSNMFSLPGYPNCFVKLRHKLPKHRWIVGKLDSNGQLKFPRGLPQNFFKEG